MEQAESYSAEDFLGQEDYQLDLCTADVDDFDFNLDGTYDNDAQYLSTGLDAQGPANTTAEFEIGYEEDGAQEEPHPDLAEEAIDEQTHPLEAAQEPSGGADQEYNDEIGYEDEQPGQRATASSSVVNAEHTQSATLDSGLSPGLFEDNPEPSHETSNTQANITESKPSEAPGHNPDLEELSEGLLGDEFADQNEDAPNLNGDNNQEFHAPGGEATSIHDPDQHYAQKNMDPTLDQEEDATDRSDSFTEIPDIAVYYNDCRYSLFGTPSDSNETYFLSDVQVLDGPLSTFLSYLREIVQYECQGHDELYIRVESPLIAPPALEFGEKSRKRFLRRSLREILDCHTTLSAVEATESPEIALHLLIRHDPEVRFRRLVGYEDTVQSGQSEASGDLDEDSLAESSEDEQQHQQSLDDETSENEVANAADEADEVVSNVTHDEGVEEDENTTDFQDTLDDGSNVGVEAEADLQTGTDQQRTEDMDHSEVIDQEIIDQQYEEIQYDENDHAGETADSEAGFTDAKLGVSGELNDGVGAETSYSDKFARHISEPPAQNTSEPFTGDEETSAAGETETALGSSSNGKLYSFISLVGHSLFQNSPSSDAAGCEFYIDYSDDEEPAKHASGPKGKGSPACSAHEDTQGPEIADIDYTDPEEATMTLASAHYLEQEASAVSLQPSSDQSWMPEAEKRRQSDLSIANFPRKSADTCHLDNDVTAALDQYTALGPSDEQHGDEVNDYAGDFLTMELASDYVVMEHGSVEFEGVDGVEEDVLPQTATSIEHGTTGSAIGDFNTGADVTVAQATVSNHTSATSTINGDEIDYEENDPTAESFMPEATSQQWANSVGDGNDEIDWENDADDDDVAEPKETSPSPSIVSVKRSRPDEEESLADETDHKRRRT
ncbi:hypothetical protein B0H63DRAFT_528499 [Podospora didyma]|uniref:Uncharacterized protein n=1 Tax=Podospora didyma TaxID=330526 RepID=A0AAE0K2C7_9PEZI|nr:hypothetical protein B0H63DRAFT_528499 [Podospora didyma]